MHLKEFVGDLKTILLLLYDVLRMLSSFVDSHRVTMILDL